MPLFTDYDTPAPDAIRIALDHTRREDCATVKFDTGDLSFTIEYATGRPQGTRPVYNVCAFDDTYRSVFRGRAIEAGLQPTDEGPGFLILETDADSVDAVLGELMAIAGAVDADRDDIVGAATKSTWAGWEDALADLLPFGERWFDRAHEQS